MPHSLDAEKAVLGSLLLRPTALDEIADMAADAFYLPAHREIVEAMRRIAGDGKRLDVVVLFDELTRRKAGVDLGYLSSLEPPTAEALGYWADIVRKKSALRRVLEVAAEMRAQAIEGEDPETVIADATKNLADIAVSGDKGGPVKLGDRLIEVLENIQAKVTEPKRFGVGTGISAFDTRFGLLRPGTLIVVAARPGIGKTALAGTVARNAAKDGIPSLVFSLEMAFQEMAERFLSAESGVNGQLIATGRVNATEFRQLHSAAGKLAEAPIAIDDRILTAGKIAATARAWRARQRTKQALVVVDYLGLIRSAERSETRALEVGRMAWAMKTMAKALDVPVILVAQLNRKNEQEKREPVLSDLRDSGEVEQHAHMVIFPHREPPLDQSGAADLIVAKNRGGITGKVAVWWHAETTTFAGQQEQQPRADWRDRL